MLNEGYKGFGALNSLVELSAKVLNNLKGFKIFILYFYSRIA
jgi:hypothetical protein